MPDGAINQFLQPNGDAAKAALARAKFKDSAIALPVDDKLWVLRTRLAAEKPIRDEAHELCGRDEDMLGAARREHADAIAKARTETYSNVVPLVPRPNWKGPEFGASAREMAVAQGRDSSFHTFVAADRSQRERAFRLAFRVYRDCGYVVDTEDGRIVSRFDADPRTLVLLVQDSSGRDAATVSLVFDSPAGLPCDEIHGAELAPLRAQGRRLAEVTRLAIDLEYAGSKALLVQLFNFISVYGRHVEHATDCMIGVHPRHVNYYRRLLMFEAAGPERACPRVNGAPAKLLRLDLAAQVAEIGIVGGTQGQARGPRGRTLYSHFCALDQEPQLAAFMRSQQRPMTAEERCHFQLDGAETSARPAQISAGAAGRTMVPSAFRLIPGHAFNYFMPVLNARTEVAAA